MPGRIREMGKTVNDYTHMILYCDDVVGWRTGDLIWTVKGEVPLLSIGCPGATVQVFAGLSGKAFPVARGAQALEPANAAFRVLKTR